jgi:glycosyltransferase involved in cell wall biosynthesis
VDIGEQERFKRLKFAVIKRGGRAVIAVTDSLRDDLLERTQLESAHISVIYNGIDTARFRLAKSDRLRRQFGWPGTALVIGSLGNIRPPKAYDILLQTAAKLAQKSAGYRFLIAGQGKGQLYDDLLAMRRELGLEEVVKFLGFLDDILRSSWPISTCSCHRPGPRVCLCRPSRPWYPECRWWLRVSVVIQV